MELILDGFYIFLLIICLSLVYCGCKQDFKSIKHVKKNYKTSKKIKFSETKKNVLENNVTVLEDPPSYSDVVG